MRIRTKFFGAFLKTTKGTKLATYIRIHTILDLFHKVIRHMDALQLIKKVRLGYRTFHFFR